MYGRKVRRNGGWMTSDGEPNENTVKTEKCTKKDLTKVVYINCSSVYSRN